MAERDKPNKRWSWRRVLLDVAVLALAYWGISAWQSSALIASGTPAPALELQSLEGKTWSLETLKGRRVLLHFWATWCGVCRREHDALNALQEKLGPEELLLSVVLDADDESAGRRAVAEGKVRYPVLMGNAAIQQAYRVRALPTNYFVDAAGAIAGSSVGMSTRWGLGARLGCAR